MLLDTLAATGAVVAMLHSSTVIDTDPVIMYVIAQAQRWRCGRYRPDRTLVAPLSSTEYLDVPAEDAERELTVVFRGTCVPDGGKDPSTPASACALCWSSTSPRAVSPAPTIDGA